MKKQAFIYVTAESLFLCACKMNYDVKLTRSTESKVELIGSPEFFPPNVGEKHWKGIWWYTYESDKIEGLLE